MRQELQYLTLCGTMNLKIRLRQGGKVGMENRRTIETTSFSLHILAMICMLCDHLWGASFVSHEIFTCIGRLTFPIYAFLLVEGYFHTGSLKKYVKRLFLFAVLSEIPFNLVMGSSLFYPVHQNVLWSFLIAIGLIHWNEKAKGRQLWKRILVGIATLAIAFVGGLVTFVDYYHAGIFMVLTFYFFRGKRWWNYLGQLLCMWYLNCEVLGGLEYVISLSGYTLFVPRQGIALLALLPIWLYRGKQGYHSKPLQSFYYLFYPVHLLILGILKGL